MGLVDRDYMRDRAKRRLKGLGEMRAPGDRVYSKPTRRIRWSKLLIILPAAFGTVVGIALLLTIADRIAAHGLLDLTLWAQDQGYNTGWMLGSGGAGIIGAVAWFRVRRR